jgi:hypothetical protein
MTPREIADLLDAAPRLGAATDEPEGARWIQLSDTLATKLAKHLRGERPDGLPRGHRETCASLIPAATRAPCDCGAEP